MKAKAKKKLIAHERAMRLDVEVVKGRLSCVASL